MPEQEMNQVPPYEFYTQKRWGNWLERAKESGFQIKESEEEAGKESAVFVNMVDDVILACLKVTARFEKGMLSREKALEILAEIRDIVLAEVEPISEDIDLMIESVQTSLMGALVAFESYIMGDYDEEANIEELIKLAIEAEASDNLELALDYTAQCGALVLKGKSLPEEVMADLPYGIVAEWLDGIDSISAAMVGSDSYKEFEEGDEEDII
ncbi:hypothetical protein MTHERMMSTA1_08330 [Methanosarcina thermophila MST-A1]|uniref:DUF2150 domain-containing protein n=4 Tax=Methanosarcina thermophila TaxID=2210 RepID=A0A0E3L0C1_METTE|nr:DUF2150 family protein [Methanosarcina thermophila]ALK05386.1 MAG: hypothetical protein AAY43_06320 [Methanosarcina sp. 795]AKB14186.1 hypothetical protein MSTHT_2428 [Methanosarcina thermophila TM-1]AKB15172.1 hypothetical protein MSTHC_0854 [Methanosarcina thermophila CHTI-55]NLU58358.1 DUF2150 family protein [Methanosarcina thermophila]BAW29233.1 conserved hypothetical protein [Methanosarcina thermophila]